LVVVPELEVINAPPDAASEFVDQVSVEEQSVTAVS